MRAPAFFSKLLTQYFRYTAIAVVVIILGAGYGLLINNKIAAIQKVNISERTRIKNLLAQDNLYVESMRQSLALFKKSFSASDLQRLDTFLPAASELPSIMLTMKNIGQAANFTLQQISITEVNSSKSATANTNTSAPTGNTTTKSSGIDAQINRFMAIPGLVAQDLNVTYSGLANYAQYKNFLSIFESSEPLMDVMNVAFTQPASDKMEESTYSFQVRTYYLPEKQLSSTGN